MQENSNESTNWIRTKVAKKRLFKTNIHSHNNKKKHNIKPKTNFTEQLKMNTKMMNKKKHEK